MTEIGNLFVIVGPSGVGKGTLIKRLIERVPYFFLSISATTRSPRNGEKDGVNYHFLSRDEFEKKIEQKDFLEWASIYGNYYGTLKNKVEEKLSLPIDVILEIDIQGARQIMKSSGSDTLYIFIKPPSEEVLKKRLTDRGTENGEEIEKRLSVAIEELKSESEFKYVVVNDDLDVAVDNLVDIIIKCRESNIIN